ncbi:uncharacterized protein Z518_05389 [Rhinocladiella mackenziei CBS 650.93]|uniref:BHLH domain-containing protein n=1 Tax=Rhinocladiella mackenziei CBS 650.93 TaxID=1442369 RepID=A0A0D2IFE9_9EURO|nr:uncharacterized protein Z518_05389 [Rhinocladiella mackenziei CBS 650.93]KIX04519.1 hypothetical protein Z518_05389 [Rhinocladiella mackenziei CBS 650.93]
MPRPRPPPTPAGSTDLKAVDKVLHSSDMETIFSLPPPALRSIEAQSHSHNSKSTTQESSSSTTNTTAFSQSTPPVSPKDKPLTSSPRHKRTASGAVKATTESSSNPASNSSYALPPPPSRARKIIQMKPKSTHNSSPASDASYHPPASTASNSVPKSTVTAANSKRKQPSATSAAGRKIARKTAHSIIERRRRSKMNEEFGVLKDMIPACEGVEMHKLAILQAGIEYVRYLEGCVAQLKAENEKKGEEDKSRMQLDDQRDDDELDDEDGEEEEDAAEDLPDPAPPAKIRSNRRTMSAANEWPLRDSRKSSIASLSSSSYPSPHLHSQPQGQVDEQGTTRKRPSLPAGAGSFSASPSQISTQSNVTSATPTPTLLSPAFNSIHFSPDLVRTQTNSSVGKSASSGSSGLNPLSTSGSWTTVNPNPNPSPSMQPLPSPKAAMHLPLPHPPPLPLSSANLQLPQPCSATQRDRETHSKSPGALSDGSGTAEATASAALMMLTNEWRGGGREQAAGRGGVGQAGDAKERGKGMSVRDLLSS